MAGLLTSPLVECVPNLSEGRDPEVVARIRAAAETVPGVTVLHQTLDPDHHRSVLTFIASPRAAVEAAVRLVAAAAAEIDLTRHVGAHPRLGAVDVIPFVPLRGVTLADCALLAQEAGHAIWKRVGVPVYFYGAAALQPERANLEDVRRGQFESLQSGFAPDRHPDVGDRLHPTAGACIVGARTLLVAWNVTLGTQDVTIARRIAKAIRYSSGGFRNVKALGLALPSRNLTQVSMNLTNVEQTPMHRVFEAIRREAARHGTAVLGSEIIGLLPRRVVEEAADHYLQFENFHPGLILESRLDEETLLPPALAAHLRHLAARSVDPALAARLRDLASEISPTGSGLSHGG